jgi:DNA-directed RNA polymerase specialized sigma24 family protein
MSRAERPIRISLRRFAAQVDAECVVQETFLRVWQVAHRVVADGEPNSLLRLAVRIARNLAIDETRRRCPEIKNPLDEGPDIPDDTPDPAPPPDPLLRERILECLRRLPRQPLTALLARLDSAGGASDHALAESVRMTLNTFLQNITRARRLLNDCLRQHGIEVA